MDRALVDWYRRFPEGWWGYHWSMPEPMSAVEIIGSGSLDARLMATLWALMAREPMPRWTAGRISLLGDACHPMLPFLAQGANSAIEDGMVLANCLKTFGRDVPAALNFYEQSRHERTSRLVRGSAANTDLFHNPALADGKGAAHFIAENWRPDRVSARYDWIFDYDATRELAPA